MFMFDGADPAFSLSAAKAAGAIAISVYIVGNPGNMPHADKARVDAIRADGMGALPNWERAADFFSTCTVAEAKGAGAEALVACKQLGFPADGTVQCAFSFDFQVPTSRFPEMAQKVDAVAAGLTGAYITMVYAQQNLIDYLVTHGHLDGAQWLMASTWGLPYDPHADPNICLVQGHNINGQWITDTVAGTDINTIIDPYKLRAWWPDGSPYGGDMTPAELDSIQSAVWSHAIVIDNQTPNPTWTAEHTLKRAYTEANAAKVANQSLQTELDSVKAELDAVKAAITAIQGGGSPTALSGTANVTIALSSPPPA